MLFRSTAHFIYILHMAPRDNCVKSSFVLFVLFSIVLRCHGPCMWSLINFNQCSTEISSVELCTDRVRSPTYEPVEELSMVRASYFQFSGIWRRSHCFPVKTRSTDCDEVQIVPMFINNYWCMSVVPLYWHTVKPRI